MIDGDLSSRNDTEESRILWMPTKKADRRWESKSCDDNEALQRNIRVEQPSRKSENDHTQQTCLRSEEV